MNSVKIIETVGICTNPKCEKLILKGNRIWKKGSDQYCNSKCLITSFSKDK